MFVGSINQDMRSVLSEMAEKWRDRNVYVGCSGNFTVERILFQEGIKNIYSNDVSMYSCVLGEYLAGNNLKIGIKDEKYEWMKEYMQDGIPLIATLLVFSAMSGFIGRKEPYFVRSLQAYRENFAKIHANSVEKIAKAIGDTRIKDMYRGDVLDFYRNAPQDSVLVSFPPTYKAGYEKLYKEMERVFSWEPPDYKLFDEDSFIELLALMTEKKTWVVSRDHEVPELEGHLQAMVQTSLRSKPVYIYSNQKNKKLTMPSIKTEQVKIPRLQKDITGDIKLIKLTQGQFDSLRAQYLGKNIVPGSSSYRFGLVDNSRLFGVLAFNRPNFDIMPNLMYMMSDFAVAPSEYKRLSKLVVGIAVSKEIQTILQQAMGKKVENILTTAFTEKNVSMKYRGIFDIYNKKEDQINYHAHAGKWSIKECFEWWKTKHAKV